MAEQDRSSGFDGPGDGRDDQQAEVVLSAERARVATRRVPRERVRVRREVVSREVSVVVTVRQEVLHIEREPWDETGGADGVPGVEDPGAPAAGPAGGARLPLEVVLSEERPVVSLVVEPYERVRLAARVVRSTAAVEVDLRREVADVVADGGTVDLPGPPGKAAARA